MGTAGTGAPIHEVCKAERVKQQEEADTKIIVLDEKRNMELE